MNRLTVLAVVAALALTSPVLACDKHKNAKSVATLASGKVPGCCALKLKGAVAEAMKSAPKMTYKVGDVETCCFETATKMAGDKGKIDYIVDGKAHADKTGATLALASLLDQHAEELQTMQFAVGKQSFHCPVSAQAAVKDGEKMTYRLAGFDFESKEKANSALQRILAALKGGGAEKPKIDRTAFFASKADADYAKTKPVGDVAAAKKGGCPKARAAAAAAAAGETLPCHKQGAAVVKGEKKSGGADAKFVSNKKKGGCNKKGGCPKARAAAAAAAAGDKPCNKTGAVAASDKPCDKPCGAKGAAGCCRKAEARLAKAQSKIQTIVEAAAEASLSS